MKLFEVDIPRKEISRIFLEQYIYISLFAYFVFSYKNALDRNWKKSRKKDA